MAAGFPTKANFATGDVLSATNMNDLAGTVNLITPSAKGDLYAGSAANTYTKLAVGTNGQVLTADSTATTGLKWAAGASGSYTLLKKASFSNVADTGTTFDNLFTSAYDNYMIMINGLYAVTTSDIPRIQLRYAGPTSQATTYNWRYAQTDGTAWTFGAGNSPSVAINLAARIGAVSGYGSSFAFTLMNTLSSGSRPYFTWNGFIEDEKYVTGGGYQYTSRTYTGFLVASSSSNIYGTVSVYGMANA